MIESLWNSIEISMRNNETALQPTNWEKDRQTDGRSDGQAGGRTDRHRGIHRDRQTDRQTEREREREWVVYKLFPFFRGRLQECLFDVFYILFEQFSVYVPVGCSVKRRYTLLYKLIARHHGLGFRRNITDILPTSLPELPIQLGDLRSNQSLLNS